MLSYLMIVVFWISLMIVVLPSIMGCHLNFRLYGECNSFCKNSFVLP